MSRLDRRTGSKGGGWAGLGLLLGWVLNGCSVAVATNLDEPDANQAVALLERAGLGPEKEKDTDHEGHFRVRVPSPESGAAIGILAQENLPPKPSPGVLETLGQAGVVPSRLAERARWTTGVAGDLERSLRTLDGVLSARVHLAVPERDSLDPEAPTEHATASVLLRHRGLAPPLAALEIQRLVAGAVPGLEPERVSVVLTPTPGLHLPEPDLQHIGPITVTRRSAPVLRILVAASALFNVILVAAIGFLWARSRRTELSLAEARAAAEGDGARARK
jgi:type III secretion system YscJ/HrcJ family lipoprotein